MDNNISLAERLVSQTPSVENIIKAWIERKRAGKEINIDKLHGHVQSRGEWPAKWQRLLGKSGTTWWIPVSVPNRASFIHCRNMNDARRSEGYGGRVFTFNIEDGSVDNPQGPWHSNSSSLYKDTGVDIRNENFTWGVIFAEGNFYKGANDVIYADSEPTLGFFYRIDILAAQIADALGHPVICYGENEGGSHCGSIKPGDLERNRHWYE